MTWSTEMYSPPTQPAEGSPTLTRRSELQQRPAGRLAGRHRWNQLIFAHWNVDPAAVQASLPRGLYVDTFAGVAYLGIVPFAMERFRPAWLPLLPGLSWFLELNVFTYVFDENGQPGVWFYSLDCNQAFAVAIAQRFFSLPYCPARRAAALPDGEIHYKCQRRDEAARPCAMPGLQAQRPRPSRRARSSFFWWSGICSLPPTRRVACIPDGDIMRPIASRHRGFRSFRSSRRPCWPRCRSPFPSFLSCACIAPPHEHS